MTIKRNLTKFISLPFRDKMFFLEALFLQVGIGFLLKLVPFRKIPGLFKNREQGSGFRVQGSKLKEQETLLLLKAAIQRAAMISPWRNKCLVSSLAARCMLNRRKIGSQLSLGVAKGPGGKMVAHAWLKAGNLEIVERIGDYYDLFAF